MKNVLTVENLCKNYDNFKLDNVCFSLNENSITGFIGKNGAGKTTTIKILLGLVKKESGNINFFNFDFENNEKEIKDKLGIILGNEYYYKSLKINEMKNIIALAYSQWDDKTFYDYLNFFKISPKQTISTLSTGMCMQFSLAIALSHHAQILILDEPTNGLDPLTRKRVKEVMLDFSKKEENSILFSTHIISDIEDIADKILFINNGKIILDESKTVLLNQYNSKNKSKCIEDIIVNYMENENEKFDI